MVRALLAGQEKYLILDTGGAKSILDPEIARELGLQMGQFTSVERTPFSRGYTVQPSEVYTDVTGRQSSSFAIVDAFELGDRHFGPIEFVLSPTDNDLDNSSMPVGTLGADFLIAYDVVFDFGTDEFQLYSPNNCDNSRQPGASADADSVTVPFSVNGSNHIRFPISLDGQNLTAVLDTGAHNTILSLPAAQRLFSVDLNAPDVIRTGELARQDMAGVYRRRFFVLRIESLSVTDPMIFLLPDLMAANAAPPWRVSIMDRTRDESAALPEFILGMSVLSHYRLEIAYQRREFYLIPVPGN
nr:MAG: hypothetical protein E4H34_04265 [Hyphomicrobiales bacterium]